MTTYPFAFVHVGCSLLISALEFSTYTDLAIGQFAPWTRPSDNRGCKGGYYEGGVRGVGLIHGVGLKETGVVNDGMHHVNDWMPTLLSAAAALRSGIVGTHQVKLGEGEVPFMMGDGVDNWAMFSSGSPSKREEMIHVTQAEGMLLELYCTHSPR